MVMGSGVTVVLCRLPPVEPPASRVKMSWSVIEYEGSETKSVDATLLKAPGPNGPCGPGVIGPVPNRVSPRSAHCWAVTDEPLTDTTPPTALVNVESWPLGGNVKPVALVVRVTVPPPATEGSSSRPQFRLREETEGLLFLSAVSTLKRNPGMAGIDPPAKTVIAPRSGFASPGWLS